MTKGNEVPSVSRREFLATTGSLIATAPAAGASATPAAGEAPRAQPASPPVPDSSRKIRIGVFDPVYNDYSLDEMLDKISALGIEAVEIGTAGYPGTKHCPIAELLADPAKAKGWKRKFEDRNILVGTLSCHGNPVHPDAKIAARDDQYFRNSVMLAERLEVPVIVGFSGCPAGCATDKMPNWATYRWPPEWDETLRYQWKEKLIPYWTGAAKFARDHGIHKIGLEMHPNMSVFNPKSLMKLRKAAGEEIGANCDLSHLFWQGCDPVEVIHYLGHEGALYHAHMKDTVILKDVTARFGVLNFPEEPEEKPTDGSVYFRAVGYGHGANLWKEIVKAYMDVDYQGIMSIENEDPILTGEVGVERAFYVLRNVRGELLA